MRFILNTVDTLLNINFNVKLYINKNNELFHKRCMLKSFTFLGNSKI